MGLRFSPARGASVLISSSSRGPAGAAATIAAGSASALAAGASPTVTNSGSSSSATFNFGIPRGADAGIKWLYDSSASMADPGSGDIRFNNATLSSVNAIAVSATGSGSDVSDYVATWDDSTNTVKGYLMIREEAGDVAAIFSLSAVTDNGTWLQLTVAYVSGSLSLTASDPLYVIPLLIGNKGSDGSGTFPGSSTDNAIARFDGTGGTTVQNSAVTIDDSGVVAGAIFGNTALKVRDTDASHNLSIIPGSNLTADRNLTINTGDAARAVTLSGDPTLSDWFDQSVKTSASPQFTGIELGHASDTTITRTGAGAIAVEGVGVALNSTSLPHTASTIELGHASDTTLSRDAAGSVAIEGAKIKTVGKETIWIPCTAMVANTTNGPATGTTEQTTNKNMTKTLDFDQTTSESAQFYVAFPKSWNLGTVTFEPFWTASSGSGTVQWDLSGVAISNDDVLDVAFGTAQSSSDTLIATGDNHVGPESSAITIAGTPAAADLVNFKIARNVSDTLSADAKLIGVKLYFTTNAATDA